MEDSSNWMSGLTPFLARANFLLLAAGSVGSGGGHSIEMAAYWLLVCQMQEERMSQLERPEHVEQFLTTPLSRRLLLKRAALAGATVPVVAGLLSACGDDADDGTDDTAAEPDDSDDTADPDPGAEDDEEEDAESTETESEDTTDEGEDEDETVADADTFVVVDGTEPDFLTPVRVLARSSTLSKRCTRRLFSTMRTSRSSHSWQRIGKSVRMGWSGHFNSTKRPCSTMVTS